MTDRTNETARLPNPSPDQRGTLSGEVEELEALLAKATPGPWAIGRWSGRCHKPSHAYSMHPGRRGDDPCVYDHELELDDHESADVVPTHKPGLIIGGELSVDDRNLIVAAINALPALLTLARSAPSEELVKLGEAAVKWAEARASFDRSNYVDDEWDLDVLSSLDGCAKILEDAARAFARTVEKTA